eukprot:CAMPEP_0204173120 /NCGR_PEP_ID=MMETSP0361-20130328/44723_1 /ASSEMBLY_ACC=CAM_ASM_000343 /TAXON_ID=268821 /ORGANISM="Scrippsiella Hangoei, Strain SHTV-5" /LENGTH=62 /DNA_ID=CAMNT_0051131345 /DNA_START=46 /DNA_END=230 /DNA_ORIENTATION=+
MQAQRNAVSADNHETRDFDEARWKKETTLGLPSNSTHQRTCLALAARRHHEPMLLVVVVVVG